MEHDQKRRRVLALIGGTGIATIAGCLGGDDEDDEDESAGDDDEMDDESAGDDDEMDDELDGTAGVRAAHLSPDAPNVDVYVDDDPVLEDVPYRAVSEYLELDAGTYDVMITAAGDDEAVYEEELEIGDGDYTIAALGELADVNQPFEPAVLEDDLSDPGDQARVRLVHASPDAPAVDVTIDDGETVLVEDAAFGDDAAFEVDPGEYTLEIRGASEDNDGEIVKVFDVEPEAETVYSAFAVGYLDSEAAPDDVDALFDIELVVDASPDEDEDDDEMDDDGDETDDSD